tara:strand:+ start:99 stop:872 length:774 start_codon:yes stop_codon:yes gene_type:complete
MGKVNWKIIFEKKNHQYIKKSYELAKQYSKLKNKNLPYKLAKIVYNSKIRSDISSQNLFYKNITRTIDKKLKIKKSSPISIADYGSGNGFIILYLKRKYNVKKIYSFEIAKSWMNIQKLLIKKIKFKLVQTSTKKIKLKNNNVDFFISSSTFQYLKNLNQAKYLIKEFIRASTDGILILDILDYKTKDRHLKNKFLLSKLSKSEYKKKYKNLKLLFFKRKFFNFLKNEYKVKSFNFFNIPGVSSKKRFSYGLFIKLK